MNKRSTKPVALALACAVSLSACAETMASAPDGPADTQTTQMGTGDKIFYGTILGLVVLAGVAGLVSCSGTTDC